MDLYKIKLFIQNKNFIPVAIFMVMDLVMLAFIGYLGYRIMGVYGRVQEQKMTLESSRSTAQLVKSNVNTLSNSISEYNATLDNLIPDEESYFSVIAAFEKLAQRTGVAISSYSINLDQTTEEKLSLDLSLQADPEALLRLIRDYNFASGRLLTNESVQITYGDSSSISFTVNLIHSPTQTVSSDTSVTISPDDIQYMDEIQSKME
ncbi:hypothetical protein KBD81_05005 [Candidatus Woesebacteria bacterium]|nr:hypothetical protein [Candidatus Woesebacteria bacterium]